MRRALGTVLCITRFTKTEIPFVQAKPVQPEKLTQAAFSEEVGEADPERPRVGVRGSTAPPSSKGAVRKSNDMRQPIN